MAKRTTPRPQGQDTTANDEKNVRNVKNAGNGNAINSAERRQAAPRRRRVGAAAAPAEPAIAGMEDSRPTTPSELPDIPEPGDAADQALRSESIVTQPSEEQIRIRAYERYLERGGAHGGHFDDWLAAERELKRGRST